MRNTSNNKPNAQGYNEEYQLNKTLTLKVNDTQKTISDDVVLKASPEFNGGAVFDEYVLTVENLQAGENTITLTFKSEQTMLRASLRAVTYNTCDLKVKV